MKRKAKYKTALILLFVLAILLLSVAPMMWVASVTGNFWMWPMYVAIHIGATALIISGCWIGARLYEKAKE